MRHDRQPFSDEEIHRFVDGELDYPRRTELLERMSEDPLLAEAVNDYRRVNDLVELAFAEAEPPQRGRRASRWGRPLAWAALAASVFLPVGFVAGWLWQAPPPGSELLAGGQTLYPGTAASHNTVLHIDFDDPEAFNTTLNRAEAILLAHQQGGARVEVVANSSGLNLLREDASPFVERVRAMLETYDNFSLVACVNTLRRLERKGIRVELFDGTQTDKSAVEHVARRLQQGWTYLKI